MRVSYSPPSPQTLTSNRLEECAEASRRGGHRVFWLPLAERGRTARGRGTGKGEESGVAAGTGEGGHSDSRRRCRAGPISLRFLPRCFWGSRPRAATLMRTASIPLSHMCLEQASCGRLMHFAVCDAEEGGRGPEKPRLRLVPHVGEGNEAETGAHLRSRGQADVFEWRPRGKDAATQDLERVRGGSASRSPPAAFGSPRRWHRRRQPGPRGGSPVRGEKHWAQEDVACGAGEGLTRGRSKTAVMRKEGERRGGGG